MTLSDYIRKLENIREECGGELEVETYLSYYGRSTAREPAIAYRRVLKGRERRPDFAASFDPPDRKDEKVVHT